MAMEWCHHDTSRLLPNHAGHICQTQSAYDITDRLYLAYSPCSCAITYICDHILLQADGDSFPLVFLCLFSSCTHQYTCYSSTSPLYYPFTNHLKSTSQRSRGHWWRQGYEYTHTCTDARTDAPTHTHTLHMHTHATTHTHTHTHTHTQTRTKV